MSKDKDGKYLYHFYRKKANSLLKSINKASVTWNIEDIHGIRVEIKKIRVVFQLLEMVVPKKFNVTEHYISFRELFKHTGMIREIQINLIYLEKYNLDSSAVIPFKKYLQRKEIKLKNEFNEIMKKFNMVRFIETGEIIKKLCDDISIERIIEKCARFIVKESKRIKKLLAAENTPDEIHKIRKHFKALSAIATLLYNINHKKPLKKLLTNLKKTEIKLGIWHDRVILAESLEQFLKINKNEKSNRLLPLRKLIAQLADENSELLDKLKPAMNLILNNIM